MREASSKNCDGEQVEAVVDIRAVNDMRSPPFDAQYPFTGMKPKWVLVLLLSIPVVTTLFWWLERRFFDSALSLLEYLEVVALVTAVVTGGYQLYFWAQRHNHHYPTRCFKIALDERISFWPQCIRIYSFPHYVMIGLTVVSIGSLEEGVHLIFGDLILGFIVFQTDQWLGVSCL